MKALVVDDSRATRMVLRRTLADLGFDVASASNGREALHIMAGHGSEMALALVDWNMPEMTGLEFVRCVRAEPLFDLVRNMMATTETEIEQVARALEAGANEYIMKPFTRDIVEAKLRLLGVVQ